MSDTAELQSSSADLAIRANSADAAAEWLTCMMSGEMSAHDHAQWQRWRSDDPDHERAWQHIEAVSARLRGLHGAAAYKSLSATSVPISPERRKLLGVLLMLGVAGGAGVGATRTQGFRQLAADYRTRVGEQRTFTLDDGTQLLLNTDSAVDIRFDNRQRLLRLQAGEVMITTGHQQKNGVARERPFIVATRDGTVRALGTRFVVRQQQNYTSVAVLESAVEITPSDLAGKPQLLKSGEHLSFTRNSANAPMATDEQTSAWTRGQIVADDMRLADFIDELARYRPGVIRCNPAVADLRFSGVFPISDTNRILAMLPNSLPVQVRQYTRYWVTVEAQ